MDLGFTFPDPPPITHQNVNSLRAGTQSVVFPAWRRAWINKNMRNERAMQRICSICIWEHRKGNWFVEKTTSSTLARLKLPSQPADPSQGSTPTQRPFKLANRFEFLFPPLRLPARPGRARYTARTLCVLKRQRAWWARRQEARNEALCSRGWVGSWDDTFPLL